MLACHNRQIFHSLDPQILVYDSAYHGCPDTIMLGKRKLAEVF
jgi:hypothetical protein